MTIEDLDKNINILVVEDYPTARKAVKNCLSKLGFKNIVEAQDGSSAMDRLYENKFDLIISAWQMPDMYADDILQKINASAPIVPCIMLVNESQKNEIATRETPENSAYVTKPLTIEDLEKNLNSLLELS